tara:strand:+ start:1448 stop:1942 length:495 start_codon:yes stop_codon:yes gene_type:complete
MRSHQKLKSAVAIFFIIGGLNVSTVSAGERGVRSGDKVEIHYTGKLENGKIFDKSEGREPLKFQVGRPGIIEGINDGVLGMKIGESKTLIIPPKKAYGEWTEKMTVLVPLDKLPKGIKIGERLSNPQGKMVIIKEVKKDKALLDGNHFLAGKTLVFDIKILSIN